MWAWIALLVASLFEIVWAVGLKFTDGFSRLWPTAAVIGAMVVSVGLLGFAVKTIPIGTGYAIWTGIGAAGVATIGILVLGESASPLRLACIALIVIGVAGLKLVES